MYVLARLYLASGVELGKDEAVYWYWGQHLDASYALLPFATLKLAHALWPYQEWFLRLPSILLGALSAVLLYRLCRNHGLGERPALWATAAFALSHWTWHTSSYLHPDGFLVPCWLLALCAAQRATGSIDVRPYALMGLAGGGAVLCKYSGAFLVGGLCLWILLSHAHQDRWRLLAAFLLPALAVALPLVYAQLGSGFYLPQTLSSLSRIEGLADPFSRLFFFLVNPLFFVSPFLLYLLYRGLVRAVAQRDLLPLLPALCTIGAFLFFALYRGQIKGNWILPGLLSLWPLAFAPRTKRWLVLAAVATGTLQAAAIGSGLKHPGLYSALSGRGGLDRSYVGLVSQEDRSREPSYSWSERLCEYGGWMRFAGDFEQILRRQQIHPSLPVISTQYSIPFTLAYYGLIERQYYTIDDPRFRDLTDFVAGVQPNYPEEVLYVVRTGGSMPDLLRSIYSRRSMVEELSRHQPGCTATTYEIYHLKP